MAEICILTAEIVAPQGPWEMPRAPVMCKKFRLDPNGDLQKIPYDNAVHFVAQTIPVGNIVELHQALTMLGGDPHSIIIRGERIDPSRRTSVRRNVEAFRSMPAGAPWVMLDIDGVSLPEGMDPLSEAAREHVISLLPEPFHRASYSYQFSASAGIRRPGGQPLKSGISIHLWFWLEGALLPDKALAAYFEKHCLETGFLTKHANRAGAPVVTYGIDLAVIRNPVQPHYIAPPFIGEGVVCDLAPDQRQGLVHKEKAAVVLPKVDDNIETLANMHRRDVANVWKRECGWVVKTQATKTSAGAVRQQSYLAAPGEHRGRIFTQARAYGESAVILHFEGEHSPGSWHVQQRAPTIAVRFGDGAQVPLRELSEGAYQYVRQTLRWFDEVPLYQRQLDADGFLPRLETFATRRNVHLVQAPTGSGKTRRIIDLIQTDSSRTYLYAAPTIPLCEQMVRDLREAGVAVRFYQDVRAGELLSSGVIVTTIKSLPKFVGMALRQRRPYTLLVDEIHIGLDEAQASRNGARDLERAFGAALGCYLFTGTLTPVQVAMLGQTIESANQLQRYGPGELVIHQFAPVRRNPLLLCETRDFWIDLIRLLEKYQMMVEAGEQIPRTVIAVDTSKMVLYSNLLERLGLGEHAHVISRAESTVEEIQAATIDLGRPILICSPIFSVGLNFTHPPEVFFVLFSRLQVDQNQIVQTINRANRVRDMRPAEVRLYTHGPSDGRDLPDRTIVQKSVTGIFAQETSRPFSMDEHFMIDRATYNQLRRTERNTGRAMSVLQSEGGFQNFEVCALHNLPAPAILEPLNEDFRNSYRGIHGNLEKQARKTYADRVEEARGYYRSDIWMGILHQVDLAFAEKSELRFGGTKVTGRDLQDKVSAGLMELCGVTSLTEGRLIQPLRVMRFLSMRDPFVSGHFPRDERTENYNKVAAEKVHSLRKLTDILKRLRAGQMNGVEAGQWMAGKSGKAAILALANNESDYLSLGKCLDRLGDRKASKRDRAGKVERERIDEELFKFAHGFLRTLGITFAKADPQKPRSGFNPEAPIVPDWDFEAISLFQRQHELSLAARGGSAPDRSDPRHQSDTPVAYKRCESCLHFAPDQDCRFFHPVENFVQRGGAVKDECEDYKRVPAGLARDLEMLRQDMLTAPRPDFRANRPLTNDLGERLVFGRFRDVGEHVPPGDQEGEVEVLPTEI